MPFRLEALALAVFVFAGSPAMAGTAVGVLPLTSENQAVLVPATLGIIVNRNDPHSVELGRRYAEIRGVPPGNIIELALPRVNFIARHLMVRELARLQSRPDYPRFAGFVLAFSKPYKVDSNQSITSALSQGIADLTWNGNCNIMPENPDAGALPGAGLQAKPSMLLYGGGGPEDDVALAERGKNADLSDPDETIFLLKTADKARSEPREESFDAAARMSGSEIKVSVSKAQTLADQGKVMGYQTGLPVLKDLETLRFLPGAYADHLTSFGGAIGEDRHQTPITALVKAGATASFGTVREPCNFPEKFPNPARLLANYLHGDSLLEAYWKSIDMMTEGLLIGEPLARPFPVADAKIEGGMITLRANRHTQPFLDHLASKEGQPHAQDDAELGLFRVDSGKPERIATFPRPVPLAPGATIGSVEIEAGNAAGLLLGLMPVR